MEESCAEAIVIDSDEEGGDTAGENGKASACLLGDAAEETGRGGSAAVGGDLLEFEEEERQSANAKGECNGDFGLDDADFALVADDAPLKWISEENKDSEAPLSSASRRFYVWKEDERRFEEILHPTEEHVTLARRRLQLLTASSASSGAAVSPSHAPLQPQSSPSSSPLSAADSAPSSPFVVAVPSVGARVRGVPSWLCVPPDVRTREALNSLWTIVVRDAQNSQSPSERHADRPPPASSSSSSSSASEAATPPPSASSPAPPPSAASPAQADLHALYPSWLFLTRDFSPAPEQIAALWRRVRADVASFVAQKRDAKTQRERAQRKGSRPSAVCAARDEAEDELLPAVLLEETRERERRNGDLPDRSASASPPSGAPPSALLQRPVKREAAKQTSSSFVAELLRKARPSHPPHASAKAPPTSHSAPSIVSSAFSPASSEPGNLVGAQGASKKAPPPALSLSRKALGVHTADVLGDRLTRRGREGDGEQDGVDAAGHPRKKQTPDGPVKTLFGAAAGARLVPEARRGARLPLASAKHVAPVRTPSFPSGGKPVERRPDAKEERDGEPHAPGGAAKRSRHAYTPLAERLRPETLDEFVGQHGSIQGGRGTIRELIEAGHLPSLILWGPPGCGKTTVALLAGRCAGRKARASAASGSSSSSSSVPPPVFKKMSAVTCGVNDVRQVVREALTTRATTAQKTILFLDEIHRFNKAQQDALLPHVESGTIILIGATTENPSFEVNRALLSRCRVCKLEPLSEEDLKIILQRAAKEERVVITDDAVAVLCRLADGDARRALNMLENAVHHQRAATDALTPPVASPSTGRASPLSAQLPDTPVEQAEEAPSEAARKQLLIDVTSLESAATKSHLLYDKNRDTYYDLISALHKSVRGSDEHAAVYYLTRMLEAGEDPLKIARRIVRMASEDIGLANPSALPLCVSAYQASHFTGMPECSTALAMAVIYLCKCPKSNAVDVAYANAKKIIHEHPDAAVPLHIRNAPTSLMRQLGYATGYVFTNQPLATPPHLQPPEFRAQTYLPDVLLGTKIVPDITPPRQNKGA
ncbi:putative werner helicase interacting protein 1 [Besnoitia besnoiti]|uniref:Putative werner helicase interacting protein 1 n=1 Tax=Besnoitia besnoiti TaxID=94643 RepID=A0A2A9M0H0_BESBE|nr:putative werner helicase interacting protein 1 [Besnoitia besnoiti]PFH31449.1 putative werner helicase interacting protein 1 [Besnoitia besnoiti]